MTNKGFKIPLLLIGLMVLAGAFLRFWRLAGQSYWLDEGYTVNAILAILAKGRAILDSGQVYFCPLYCYPSAGLALILGSGPLAFRLFSALAGIALIIALAVMVKKLFANWWLTALTVFFLSFSYWQITWSRQARWYTLFALLFWLAWFFFYRFTAQPKRKIIWLALTLLFTFWTIVSHQLGYFLPWLMILWLLFASWQKRRNLKPALIAILAILILLFIGEYFLKTGMLTAAWQKISWHYSLPYYLFFYLKNYWLFIIFGILTWFLKPQERKKYLWLILPFLVCLLALSFLTNIVHYRYLFAPAIGLIILGAIGLATVFAKIWQRHKFWAIVFLIIIIGLFFGSGQGVYWPKNFYFLEADDPAQLNRPYYAYTPQPDWNRAYDLIKNQIQPGEIVISSHAHFNKIFLGQAGYWLKYNYYGFRDTPETIINDREYYVGAKVIDDLAELKNIIKDKHGYVIFDYMAIDGRLPKEMIEYIWQNFNLIFYDEMNSYSKVWVYRF